MVSVIGFMVKAGLRFKVMVSVFDKSYVMIDGHLY